MSATIACIERQLLYDTFVQAVEQVVPASHDVGDGLSLHDLNVRAIRPILAMLIHLHLHGDLKRDPKE